MLWPTETKYGPVLFTGEEVSVASTTGMTSVKVSMWVVVTLGAETGARSLWSDKYVDSTAKAEEMEAAI